MEESNPIRAYRAGAKLTLEQFGAGFGVNKSTVLRWEEGFLPAERVLEIERVTGIPRHELRPDLYPPPVSDTPLPTA
jgi:DNA-binding transcriptional regulator YdaS (Cro superfamily)